MGAGCSCCASTQVAPVDVAAPDVAAKAHIEDKAAQDGVVRVAVRTASAKKEAPPPASLEEQPEAPAAAQPAPYGGQSRKLTIVHFNVYNIEPGQRDPVGGAARFAHQVKELKRQGVNPLVLFSGDAYNPSLMSTMTMGKQMVPILNEIGVHVSCVGNHDFDYGVENMVKLNSQCNFPWLMANVLDRATDLPYGQTGTTWIQDWNGIKVGIVGLVEEEWLETLGAVNVAEMQYVDFIETGRMYARRLKEQGAELLVALTHMREPNDRKLAAECPEFHLILGGHDHHYVSGFIEPHNNLMVKSGTDFRDMSLIEVEFEGTSLEPKLAVERLTVVAAMPEDPATVAIVDEYMKLMGEKMDEVVGETLEPLDGRFTTVRMGESNLGNFVADVWRKAAGAEVCILNGGSLRSDVVHPKGPLKARDMVAILPMVDTTVVLEATGAQILAALENGVSQYPKLEGRFPQVSGIKFKFDPTKPPGQRIIRKSVYTIEFEQDELPLELDRKYKLAVKQYLAEGKDGYNVLAECKTLVDDESGVVIPSAVKNHFTQLRVLNKWDGKRIYLRSLTQRWIKKTKSSKSLNNLSALDALDAAVGGEEEESEAEDKSFHHSKSTLESQARTHGLAVYHPDAGHYCIAPIVEGRITMGSEDD